MKIYTDLFLKIYSFVYTDVQSKGLVIGVVLKIKNKR